MNSILQNESLDSYEYKIDDQIAEAWDKNVDLRSKELFNSLDDCYINIIRPWVIKTLGKYTCKTDCLLDIGCGCGFLTNEIFSNGWTAIKGIDISKKSITIAKAHFPKIKFNVQNFYTYKEENSLDSCIAIMVMNNLPSINKFCERLFCILKEGGTAIIAIPHPCFWPIKHINSYAYSYLDEKVYSFRFSTKNQKEYPSNVFYFHRPLEKYYNCFKQHGFTIKKITELPEIKTTENPDIIGFVVKKSEK